MFELWKVRATNVAVVSPAIGRCVLPLMLYERLIAGAVVEEERGHRACNRVAEGEMGVDEGGRIAVCVRHCRGVAMRIMRCLGHNTRNNEVPLQVTGHSIVHDALGNDAVLASAWTGIDQGW